MWEVIAVTRYNEHLAMEHQKSRLRVNNVNIRNVLYTI